MAVQLKEHFFIVFQDATTINIRGFALPEYIDFQKIYDVIDSEFLFRFGEI
ncbi:hypothetical protein EPIB1_1867 [Tritonibacter mobilis]|nr:hypothetical protein EPIB1_1867 [Tritonibacter mobilis]